MSVDQPGETRRNGERPAPEDDLLWQQLQSLPAFRALLRSVEARFYRQLALPAPVLDLGCGDGHFAATVFDHPLAVGIDPWWGPLQKARRAGRYQLLVQGLGDRLPFPSHHFASAFSNSVLEHIPLVQPVLDDLNRVLRPGGRLVLTMPSHYFTAYLGGAAVCRWLGLDSLAREYQRAFNRISRHAHTDPPERWAERLAQAGFAVERWQYYFSRRALRVLELGHAQGLPSAILHALTGWWVVAPWRSNLRLTEAWVRPYYEEAASPEEGAYLLFVARKSGRPSRTGRSVAAMLPPARPYSPQELRAPLVSRQQVPTAPESPSGSPVPTRPSRSSEAWQQPLTVAAPAATDARLAALEEPSAPHSGAQTVMGRRLINGSLLGLCLLALLLGQASLNREPDNLRPGLTWIAIGLGVLALLAHRRRTAPGVDGWLVWRWPDWRSWPRQRWLYPVGLLLSVLAYRQVGPAVAPGRTGLALILWLLAIGLAVYALWGETGWPRLIPALPDQLETTSAARSRFAWATEDPALIAVLFLLAFLIRAIGLLDHPFILNGSEANLGLDAVAVIRGTLRNPFGSAWLTNPSLPIFILSVPVRVFGPSMLASRLLSPLVGAATVALVYALGRRLFDRPVALAAAVILLGAHAHVHYSRLGLTNIWDPLLVWFALGGLALAWQSERPWYWAWVGLAVGLGAYFYAAAHLLPLMLVGLSIWLLLFHRPGLAARRPGLVRAGLLALVVAWPQLAYYSGAPEIFMERANVLGLFAGGWLQAQALAQGQSEITLLGRQLLAGLLAFNTGPDTSTAYNAGVPLLRLWPALFFILGLALTAVRAMTGRRRLPDALLLVWYLTTAVFAAALLQGSPASHRLLVAAPALALLAAQGLVWLARLLAPHFRPLAANPLLLVAVLALALSALDLQFYFGAYRQQLRFGDRNSEAAFQLARYLDGLDGDWSAYFFGPPAMYASFPTIPYLAPDFAREGRLIDVDTSLTALPPPATMHLAFVFLPERFGELERAAALFPGGAVRQFDGAYAAPLFYVYEVSR